MFANALECGFKKAIHISTTAVYYDGTSKTNLTESSPLPLRQTISYAATKLESELIAQRYFKKGLSGVVLRPRAILSDFDQTLIPRLLPRMKRGFFPLIDDGAGVIDLTPAESICLAVENALNAGSELDGRIYNLTNGEQISIRDLLFKMSEIFNLKVRWIPLSMGTADRLALGIEKIWPLTAKKEPPFSKYAVDLISKSQSFNIEKIRRELSYHPQISVMERLKKMKNWKPIQ
jgi:nucleoside-diphosphate-sugar epimerase